MFVELPVTTNKTLSKQISWIKIVNAKHNLVKIEP